MQRHAPNNDETANNEAQRVSEAVTPEPPRSENDRSYHANAGNRGGEHDSQPLDRAPIRVPSLTVRLASPVAGHLVDASPVLEDRKRDPEESEQ